MPPAGPAAAALVDKNASATVLDTLGGATSNDVARGAGHPGGGVTNRELRKKYRNDGSKPQVSCSSLPPKIPKDAENVHDFQLLFQVRHAVFVFLVAMQTTSVPRNFGTYGTCGHRLMDGKTLEP